MKLKAFPSYRDDDNKVKNILKMMKQVKIRTIEL